MTWNLECGKSACVLREDVENLYTFDSCVGKEGRLQINLVYSGPFTATLDHERSLSPQLTLHHPQPSDLGVSKLSAP